MDRKQFAEELVSIIGKGLEEQHEVSISPYYGEARHFGIIIRHKKTKILAPCYRVQDLYEEFVNGRSVEDIAENLIINHLEWELSETPLFETEYWESVKENICFYLVNAEKNKKLLENVPHRKYLDLAIIYYLPVNTGSEVKGYKYISFETMEVLGMTEESLYELAYANTQRLQPCCIMSMFDMLHEMLKEMDVTESIMPSETKMYVLTNPLKDRASGVILYKDVVRNLAKMLGEEKIILIPSSIHEWIAVPYNVGMSITYFNEMVCEVNDKELSKNPKDILSDHVYAYDIRTDTISDTITVA